MLSYCYSTRRWWQYRPGILIRRVGDRQYRPVLLIRLGGGHDGGMEEGAV